LTEEAITFEQPSNKGMTVMQSACQHEVKPK